MTYTVQAAEVIYDDTNANSHKFWRYYVVGPSHWVAHWGRMGAEGQFKLFNVPNAQSAAYDKLAEKLGKGYDHSPNATQSFAVDDTQAGRWRQGADIRSLANFYQQQNGAASVGRTKAQQQAEEDAFAEEQLKATLLKMAGKLADPDEASTPVEEPAIDPNSMEARLTAALAKASAK